MKTKPMIMAHGNLILPLTVGQKSKILSEWYLENHRKSTANY